MDYRPIDTAPESKTMRVVWGLGKERPEYGEARRLGDSWFIYGETNSHANGRPCAAPDGWLPEDQREWTDAEREQCNRLAWGGLAEATSANL